MPRKTMPKNAVPTFPPQRAIEILGRLIDQAELIQDEPWNSPRRSQWTDTVRGALERAFGTNHSILQSFQSAQFYAASSGSDEEVRQEFNSILSSMVAVLRSGVEQLRWEVDAQASMTATSEPIHESGETTTVQSVRMICRRFHIVARQLTRRHDNRETLQIQDEYDVQDLLHALLRLHFDDVRPEEWTPSYAGGASRMDFLLKSERLVIEAKMVRASLGEKQIGEQLIVDTLRYRAHPDFKTFVCFVYDPTAHLRNPRGLETDLVKLSSKDLEVIAIIAPP